LSATNITSVSPLKVRQHMYGALATTASEKRPKETDSIVSQSAHMYGCEQAERMVV
jgi:hypothetical protein